MQMNNRQLYEKIMRNVSKVVKNALNESFDSDFDEELNSYINKLRALPLSLADFYDVGELTRQIQKQRKFQIDMVIIQKILYSVYMMRNICGKTQIIISHLKKYIRF